MSRRWAVLFDAGNTLLFLDYGRMAQAVGGARRAADRAGVGRAALLPRRCAWSSRAAPTSDRARRIYSTRYSGRGRAGRPPGRRARDASSGCTASGISGAASRPDTQESLARLRAAGLRLGVVSNSDGRVEEALRAAGLDCDFDVIVDSDVGGSQKPDPAIFRPALDALGVLPEEAVYVGDLYDVDVAGARAAGMAAILFTAPDAPDRAGCATVELARRPGRRLAHRRDSPHDGSRHDRSLSRPIRVLVAKPGLDGHDRGAKVVAAALRDAGMEVVYTGLHQTPEMIATAAVQEDVDVVGLSILSGAHMTLFPRVRQLLDEMGRPDILVTGGGIIPAEDMAALQQQGIGRLFGPGTPTSDLIEYIESWAVQHLEP